MPFRDAHEVVGQAVRLGIDSKRDLADISLEELREFSDRIGPDVYQILQLEGSVAARNHIGGTAPARVREAIKVARSQL